MAYNIFLDTNIIVDFFVAERKEHKNAVNLIDAAEKNFVKACISESVINTTAYLVGKSLHVSEFRKAMIELNTFIKVLPCSNIIIGNAYKSNANDLEDAVLYQIASEGKADYFITSNKKDFKKIASASLPVVSTKEILELLEMN